MDGDPTYLGRGDPAGRFADYYPAWVDKMADDVNFVGPWGDNGLIEDYTGEVGGKPLGALHLISFNADGQAQHIAANYRPLSSVLFVSRLLRDGFENTPYAEHFFAGPKAT